MPLFLATIGAEYTIIRIAGNEKIRHHMESLGFIVGARVSVVSKFNNYLLVNIKDSRIGISGEMSKKIIIK